MIKLICCDCNGVLEHIDHDYSNSGYYLIKDNKNIHIKINNYLFNSKYLLKSWMINEITYKELNRIIANKFNIDAEYLDDILIQSIKNYEWNWDLINLFQRYREKEIKIIMTTNNMDIFTEVVIPYNNFYKYFDEIYNSSDIKYLKGDNNLQLYREISAKYKLDTSEILIIDDNVDILENANKIGYKTYLYNKETYTIFEKWFMDNKSL